MKMLGIEQGTKVKVRVWFDLPKKWNRIDCCGWMRWGVVLERSNGVGVRLMWVGLKGWILEETAKTRAIWGGEWKQCKRSLLKCINTWRWCKWSYQMFKLGFLLLRRDSGSTILRKEKLSQGWFTDHGEKQGDLQTGSGERAERS